MNAPNCRLIARTCTTSWFDWVHGELWLCDTGILRRSLGLIQTITQSLVIRTRGLDPRRPQQSFTATEIVQIVRSGRRNRWIPFEEVEHATLKLGVIDHSLHVVLKDGQRLKFLWLAAEGGFDLLSTTLHERLLGRFTTWRQPLG